MDIVLVERSDGVEVRYGNADAWTELAPGATVAAPVAYEGLISVVAAQPGAYRALIHQAIGAAGGSGDVRCVLARKVRYPHSPRHERPIRSGPGARGAISALAASAPIPGSGSDVHATALTGEKDLPTAIKKAARAGLIPRPLDDMIIRGHYAYSGNEPGVGHVGLPPPPSVGPKQNCSSTCQQPLAVPPHRSHR